MKLPVALAALFLAATTAVPASAATAYRDGFNANAYHAYAMSPRAEQRAASGWGHCVRGLDSSAYSAFPAWDVCRGG